MKGLLILDRYGYQVNDSKYKDLISKKYSEVEILYTKYEDSLIRKVRNWPVIGNFMLHVLRWGKSLNYALYAIRQKNVEEIICLNPIVGVMIGLLSSTREHKNIITAGFLFENKNNKVYYALRKSITKKALKRISKVVVYGSDEVEYYEDIFKLKDKFCFIPYGIDYMNQINYDRQRLPERYMFSGGGSNRDYRTLIDAYNKISEYKYPLVIATQPWRLKDLDTDDIIVLPDVVNETFGDVMIQSEMLILSLQDTKISAGHMVMLQAMSLGVPILVNDIPSIRDYVDETMVEFYPSGDVEALIHKIQAYMSNEERIIKAKQAQYVYEKKYTSYALVARLLEIL